MVLEEVLNYPDRLKALVGAATSGKGTRHFFFHERRGGTPTPPPSASLVEEKVKRALKFGKLPIDVHQKQIEDAVSEQNVVLVRGETGCGKSTRVPFFLLRTALEEARFSGATGRNVRILVTQPTRYIGEYLRTIEGCSLKELHIRRQRCGPREYNIYITVCASAVVVVVLQHIAWTNCNKFSS